MAPGVRPEFFIWHTTRDVLWFPYGIITAGTLLLYYSITVATAAGRLNTG